MNFKKVKLWKTINLKTTISNHFSKNLRRFPNCTYAPLKTGSGWQHCNRISSFSRACPTTKSLCVLVFVGVLGVHSGGMWVQKQGTRFGAHKHVPAAAARTSGLVFPKTKTAVTQMFSEGFENGTVCIVLHCN